MTARAAPTATDVEAFRARIEAETRAGYARQFGEERAGTIHREAWITTVTTRRKYIAVDVGQSGRYLIDRRTGETWGIKGYGVPHFGRFCGLVQDGAESARGDR